MESVDSRALGALCSISRSSRRIPAHGSQPGHRTVLDKSVFMQLTPGQSGAGRLWSLALSCPSLFPTNVGLALPNTTVPEGALPRRVCCAVGAGCSFFGKWWGVPSATASRGLISRQQHSSNFMPSFAQIPLFPVFLQTADRGQRWCRPARTLSLRMSR